MSTKGKVLYGMTKEHIEHIIEFRAQSLHTHFHAQSSRLFITTSYVLAINTIIFSFAGVFKDNMSFFITVGLVVVFFTIGYFFKLKYPLKRFMRESAETWDTMMYKAKVDHEIKEMTGTDV